MDSEVSGEVKFCEVCQEVERKYTCPRCRVSTCSLACCRFHKEQTSCSGVRDKTEFVPIKEFESKHLRSDYHFLEDILQTKVSAKRTFSEYCGGRQKPEKRSRNNRKTEILPVQSLQNYDKRSKQLVYQSSQRGLTLLLQPQGMSKRNDNCSYYAPKKKTIFWIVTIVFVLRDSCSMSELLAHEATVKAIDPYNNAASVGFHVKQVNEKWTFVELLQKVFDKLPTGSNLGYLLRHFKQQYQNKLDELSIVMHKLPSPANDPLFVMLLPSQTIQASLSGQQVIEFPTFYVCEAPLVRIFRLLLAPVEVEGVKEREEDEEQDVTMEGCFLVTPKESSKKVTFEEDNDSNKMLIEREQTTTVAVTSIDLKTNGLLDDDHQADDSDNEFDDDDAAEMLKFHQKAAIISSNDTKELEEGEVEGEGEGGAAACEEFMQALMEMSNKDINELQSFIEQAEQEE